MRSRATAGDPARHAFRGEVERRAKSLGTAVGLPDAHTGHRLAPDPGATWPGLPPEGREADERAEPTASPGALRRASSTADRIDEPKVVPAPTQHFWARPGRALIETPNRTPQGLGTGMIDPYGS